MTPLILVLAICVVVAIALLAPMILARRRAPQESGLTPVFEALCVGTFGRFGGSNVPICRLSIYEDFLVIAFPTPRVIPFAQLARVEVRGSFLTGRELFLGVKGGGTYQLSVRKPENVAQLLHHT